MRLLALLLLAAGPAFAVSGPGDPPAVAAVKDLDLPALRAALDGGADVQAKDAHGWTALMWAVGRGDAPMVRLLLERGGKLDAPGFSPMIEAAKGGKPDVVALLAARGLSCSTKDASGVPALGYAASLSSTATARALIACGAERNAGDGNGFTPLIRAAQLGNAPLCRYLAPLSKVDARDANGYTALMWAAHAGSAECVSALLAAKADPAAKGKDGFDAASIAARRKRDAVLALLPAPAP